MNPGDTISRYRILGHLGQGGGGVVYRAEDTLLSRPVALKFLPAETLTDADKQRFLNEARAAAQVRHPNICPVYDIEEVDGQLFIAMACLDGETLSRKTSRGPLGISEAIDIAIQTASGLERAHEVGIVHRDIKTSNIVVGPDGHVSVLDFGLALFSGTARVTATGHTVGTPAYMSPEQAEGRTVDHRTDIWSMGVVLFEMLTGKLPFGSGTGMAMFRAILSEEAPGVATWRAGVPPELQRVVQRALAKDPAQRWHSAKEMADQLKAVPRPLETAVGESSPTRTMAAVPSPPRANHRPALYTAVAVSLVAFGIYPLLKPTEAPPVPAKIEQVAVLPFRIIGDSPVATMTADGIVEILTTTLSELEPIKGKIAAIPASEIRRLAIASAAEARRVYGATLAVTGSVQPSGEKLLFAISLIDTATKLQVRAMHFEYDPKNPIASRNGAIDRLAQLLQTKLSPASQRSLSAGDSSNPTAYEAYLHGLGLLARNDVKGNVDRAITSFESATKQDPAFALAFARLGEAYSMRAKIEYDSQAAALAITNAERSVRLDPKLATTHWVLGAIYGSSKREEAAIVELRKALEIEPGNADAQRELARVLANLGRAREAEEAYLQSTKLRPTDWYAHLLLGTFYAQHERYKEAEASLNTAQTLTPDNDVVKRILGAVFIQQGRYQESEKILKRALAIKEDAGAFATLGSALYRQHRFKEAHAATSNAVRLAPKRYYYWGNLGVYAKWTPGSEETSNELLKKALALAEQAQAASPSDYSIRADLAEYRARLGDKAGAMKEIALIPHAARRSRVSRLAVAYELSGKRQEAIGIVLGSINTRARLNPIKDDPDLKALWADDALQRGLTTILR